MIKPKNIRYNIFIIIFLFIHLFYPIQQYFIANISSQHDLPTKNDIIHAVGNFDNLDNICHIKTESEHLCKQNTCPIHIGEKKCHCTTKCSPNNGIEYRSYHQELKLIPQYLRISHLSIYFPFQNQPTLSIQSFINTIFHPPQFFSV